MADIFTPRKRSAVMAKIRGSRNQSTEERFAKLLRLNRVTGWRRGTSVIGKPDFVFRKERVAVFIDGCFWHGCSTHYREPSSNVSFWRTKIARNMARDQEVTISLRSNGWIVLRFWEHDLKLSTAARVVTRLRRTLQSAGGDYSSIKTTVNGTRSKAAIKRAFNSSLSLPS